MDGVKFAGTGAVAQTQTAVGTGAGAAGQRGRSGTGLDARVVKFLAAVLAAIAQHGGPQAGTVALVSAHNGVDGVGTLVAAGSALEGGSALLHDGLGVVGTAGVAAAAAVGAGQTIGNLRDAGVLIHSHELGGQHQNGAARQTQNRQHDDRKQNGIHTLSSSYQVNALTIFSTRPPKPIKLMEVMAADTSVMGRPLKLAGGLAASTR